METQIIINKKVKFKHPVIIAGFQGVGLVGTLAAQYFVKQMKMKQVGYIDNDSLPPLALLIDGQLMHPIRVFASENRDFVVIESELPITRSLVHEMSRKISEWSKKIKAKEIICFEGIAVSSEPVQSEVYAVTTSSKRVEKVKKKAKLLNNGIIIGVSAALMLECKDSKIPSMCLMAESHSNIPDGHAAAEVLKKFNELHGTKIDVSALLKEASSFEKKIKEVISKAQQLKESEQNKKASRIYG